MSNYPFYIHDNAFYLPQTFISISWYVFLFWYINKNRAIIPWFMGWICWLLCSSIHLFACLFVCLIFSSLLANWFVVVCGTFHLTEITSYLYQEGGTETDRWGIRECVWKKNYNNFQNESKCLSPIDVFQLSNKIEIMRCNENFLHFRNEQWIIDDELNLLSPFCGSIL